MEVKILCASAGSLDLVYHDLFTMMPQMAFADEQAPAPHDASLASRYRLRWQLRPLWTFTTDERHARHTKEQKDLCIVGSLFIDSFLIYL